MKKEIKVPVIAENFEHGIIAEVLVKAGDKVSVGQALVGIETDKATTDIPSNFDGIISEIQVSTGEDVAVHQVIMTIETEEVEAHKPTEKIPVGVPTDEVKEVKTEPAKSVSQESSFEDIPAAPSVRRLARELEIDLTKVTGSGPGARITRADVENFSEGAIVEPQKEVEAQPVVKTTPSRQKTNLPDFSKWGPVSHENMNNIRKVTARALTDAWQTVPHVTQFDEADITNLEEFRKKHQAKVERTGGKLTVTSLLLKIVGLALQKFPQFNASVDMENQQIIYKHYINVGVAVDTEQGLLVPVVRDINKQSLASISADLSELGKKARNKELSLDEMQGGTFTISNLGGIGGTGFTPIVYAPQVAILGVSRSKYKPVLVGDDFEKRLVIPLALSYDHRIIDGADGARFLRWICDVIEDPYAILF